MDDEQGACEEQACASCAYFEPWARQRDPWRAQGDCRRHAPRAMEVAGQPKSVFPLTASDRWCGDWEEAGE